jgi:hypothetical protein
MYGETEVLAKFNYMIYFLFYYCATTLLFSICLILLGLLPDYVNVKLSSWLDIENKYPEIVVGLIIVSFIIIGVEPEPLEGWWYYNP